MIKISPAVNTQVPAVDALQVTAAALAHLSRRLAGTEHSTCIIIGVKKAGCSGLKYDIETAMESPDAAFEFVFQDELRIFVPHDSFPFLKGCTLDYVKQGINAQLQIINPNETGSCGCGESFSVDPSSELGDDSSVD